MTIDLDAFVRGYELTALWSSSHEGYMEDTSLYDAGFNAGAIDPDAHEAIRAECEDFIGGAEADLDAYCERMGTWHGSDSVRGSDARYSADEQAGGDFWLSRNGHGAGYFDRGNDPLFQRLQDAARVYGEQTLYVGDDERIYVA